MEYMSVTEASRQWGISDRRIRVLCNGGKVDGAIRLGWSWIIPKDAPKPSDGRHLRAIKTRNIRPGAVDIDEIARLQAELPLTSSMLLSKGYQGIIAKNIKILLSVCGESVSEKEIKAIFSGKAVAHLPLDIHLVIINFRSIMMSYITNKYRINQNTIEEIHRKFLQGINDVNPDAYRDGLCRFPYRGEDRAEIGMQIVAAFQQWEASWQNFHPLTAAVILYAEIMRIEPYEDYSEIFAFLVLSLVLVTNNILPPLLREDDGDELRAAFLIAAKRGNYEDLATFIEKRIFDAYEGARDV